MLPAPCPSRARLRTGGCPALARLAACVVMLAALGPAAPANAADDPPTRSASLVVAGLKRTHTLVGATGEPRPLLVVLHGGGGSGGQIFRHTTFAAAAARHGMVAVFPDGLKRRWNDGRPETEAHVAPLGEPPDDVAYLVALVRLLVADRIADPDRIFVTGLSNGGLMTYRLACETTGVFRGYAAMIANMSEWLVARCRPSGPRPMLVINGTLDPLIPWNGGEIRVMGRTRGSVISALATFEHWQRNNGCKGTTKAQRISTAPAPDQIAIDRIAATSCAPAGPTILYRMTGVGHQVPRPNPPRRPLLDRWLGPNTDILDAAEEIAAFFDGLSRGPRR